MSIRYQYVKIPNRKYPITVSYRVLTGPAEENMLIEAGFSFCHDKDPFDKERGRMIAEGRLLKTPTYIGFHNKDVQSSYGKRIVNSIRIFVETSYKKIISDTNK